MDLNERADIAFRTLNDLGFLFVPGEDPELQDLRLEAINKFVWRYKQAKDCREELQKLHTNLDNGPSTLPSLFASSRYVENVDEKLQVLEQLMEDGHCEDSDVRERVRPQDVTRLAWAAIMVAPIETYHGWRENLEK